MTSREHPAQTLYEISLSISREESIEKTARQALSGYLAELNCSAGAVLERRDDGTFEMVTAVPPDADDETLAAGLDALPDDEAGSDALPVVGRTDRPSQYYVLALPAFGVLVLCTEATSLEVTPAELEPLNQKLAEACHKTRAEQRRRADRTRFEAVFEAFESPAVNVEFDGDTPIVQRVNTAFEETFGYSHQEALGRNLNELILPDDPELEAQAREIDAKALDNHSVRQEVKRQTVDGLGDFLVRTAPIEIDGTTEHFAMYVDITEERARQRTLEALYSKTEDILAGRDRTDVCERALRAAEGVIDLSLAGVHLYDRQSEALVPVATTSVATDVFEGEPDEYTDRETVVWEVYDTGDPQQIDDIDEYEGNVPGEETPVQSAIVLPLGDHGVFIVSSPETNAFDATDYQFARLLSRTLKIALDRENRERGLEGIQELTHRMLEADSHEAVASVALERVPDLLDLPISGIWRHDSGNGVLEPLAVTDQSAALLDEIPSFTEDNSIAGRVFETGETEVIETLHDRPDAYSTDSPLKSEIVAPIGEFGVLTTGSTRVESFSESDRRLVETLASNVETAMRLVSRRRELELLDQVLGRVLRHNLRNELTIIRGTAGVLHEADEHDDDLVEKILVACDKLEELSVHANEMRNIVRHGAQTTQLSLRRVTEQAVSTVRSEYPAANIRTEVASDATVVAHPNLEAAVQQLVRNAVEHDTGPSPPTVTARVRETTDGPMVEVVDDGPGIPVHELEILEQHGETALEHGSGVGLWIVDRVVDYSNAALEFETDDGTTARILF